MVVEGSGRTCETSKLLLTPFDLWRWGGGEGNRVGGKEEG